MRTEETVIVNTEYIYDDEEQKRMIEIVTSLKSLVISENSDVELMAELTHELGNILNGEWERPLPF